MITNIAAGIDDSSMQLTHEDVIGVSGEFAPQFTKFMLAFISNVQTKPPRSLVLSVATPLTPLGSALPQTQALVPTRADIDKAVEFLARQVAPSFDLEVNSPEVALYISYGMEDLAFYLRDRNAIASLVHVPYSTIPGFPCISRSGCRGEICFALPTYEGHATSNVFLSGNSLESFCCEEGIFVALLLAQMGVEKLVHTFFAASSNPHVRADTVRIVGDATDFTTIAPVAYRPNQPQYMSTALFNTNPSDLEDLQLAFRFAGQADTSTPLHYAHILGPSFPTRAEVHLSILCKIDLVGITSLSLVYASRSLGIDVVGLAGVSYETGEDPLADASYVLWKKMRTIIVQLFRGTFFPKHRNKVNRVRLHTPSTIRKMLGESPSQLTTFGLDALAPPPRRLQVSYQLALPVSQGSLENVQQAAKWLHDQGLILNAHLAVVLDSRIRALPFEFKSTKTVPYKAIPHFPEHAIGSVSWMTDSNGRMLVVFHGTMLMNEGLFCTFGFCCRFLLV
jgi:purine nucleoside phosphorylase